MIFLSVAFLRESTKKVLARYAGCGLWIKKEGVTCKPLRKEIVIHPIYVFLINPCFSPYLGPTIFQWVSVTEAG